MDRSTAKDLVHIDAWLALVATIAAEGQDNYQSDALLQEAGDSLRSIAAARRVLDYTTLRDPLVLSSVPHPARVSLQAFRDRMSPTTAPIFEVELARCQSERDMIEATTPAYWTSTHRPFARRPSP